MIPALFRFAPRSLLRHWELGPLAPVASGVTDHALRGLQSLKIAVVKQEVLAAIPNLPGKHGILDFLKSAGGHTGFLSLFHELGAELVLVREESSPECQTWRQKVSFDPDPAYLERLYRADARETPFWTPSGPQTRHEASLPAGEVDWTKYDLVVGLDIPVPEKIVRAHSRTIWAYMITETAMPAYRLSRKSPLFGYDLFLNQKCRLHAVRPSNRWHEIDFPWAFQTPECYAPHFSKNRLGIFLDPHTAAGSEIRGLEKDFSLSIRAPRGISSQDWVRELASTRYLIRITEKRNWGNLLIEAACAGALVLADPSSLENPAPLLRELVIRSPQEASRLVRELEANPKRREELSAKQTERVRELAFARPLRQLWHKVDVIRKSRCRP
ncbi:MAG: glycosyltransferase family 1 protein [Verrucomicrobia bacterium]|nr:glycosyltransferase family 1 protein [Verrucomicrobiota bacterium]